MFEQADIISSYSRADAIEDGVLIDVTGTAREAGIKYPVAMTAAVWGRYVEFDADATPGQDVWGRLWDLIYMAAIAMRRSEGPVISYSLHFAMADRGDWEANESVPERGSGLSRRTHRLVSLKAICGPGDTAEPVITIMLPNED